MPIYHFLYNASQYAELVEAYAVCLIRKGEHLYYHTGARKNGASLTECPISRIREIAPDILPLRGSFNFDMGTNVREPTFSALNTDTVTVQIAMTYRICRSKCGGAASPRAFT